MDALESLRSSDHQINRSSDTRVQHVKSVVCQLAHDNNIDLFASKRQQKRVEFIELVRKPRDQRRQEVAFNSRP